MTQRLWIPVTLALPPAGLRVEAKRGPASGPRVWIYARVRHHTNTWSSCDLVRDYNDITHWRHEPTVDSGDAGAAST